MSGATTTTTPGPQDLSKERVIRWFTRARKFPQLVGRTASGSRIPGGPYTVTQVMAGLGTLMLGWITMRWWAHWSLIGNWGALLGVSFSVVKVVGLIPFDSRSPVSVINGLSAAIGAPSGGELSGRAVRSPRTVRVRGGVVIALSTPPGLFVSASVPAAVCRAGTAPTGAQRAASAVSGIAARPRAVELTGVQRTLAALTVEPVNVDA